MSVQGQNWFEAARNGNLAQVTHLLDLGIPPVDYTDLHGNTALMYAIEEGHADVVEKLLAHGADVNLQDKSGHTPLIWASMYGRADVVGRLLAKEGVAVNQRDRWGMTALMYASMYGHAAVVGRLLAKGGVDVNQGTYSHPVEFV